MMAKGDTVYVLTYEHKHGEDISVHSTREAAEDAIFGIVFAWWNDLADEDGVVPPMPEDPKEAVSQYFAGMEDREWYGIEETEVQ